ADRGRLIVEKGIVTPRHRERSARVGHGLRRLVIVGADGFVSLAALRWLADQDVAFVMLDRTGSVLVATGPVRPSESKLRRAQAVVHLTGAAMPIVRRLIDQKLAGQERIARDRLHNAMIGDDIAAARDAVNATETVAAA